MADQSELNQAYLGFRERFLDYATLTAQVQGWADAFDSLVRLESLGTTPEGREIWMLTIGTEPDRIRPAAWVDGNMHASELCGSSVALAIAEDVLRVHVEPDANLHGLPPHVQDILRKGLLYVVPRISPDGAEAVLDTGRYVRSVPRDDRPQRAEPRWTAQDIDGDGLSLLMRVEDPSGELTESDEVPGLLLPRRLEDTGPFYKVYPEGLIENFDGHHVPSPSFLSDNDPDLNRNFPWSWAPEPDQIGAGPHPLSEIEARVIVERACKAPHIFAWLNLHTFGGVFIRPLGDAPDNKMDQEDLALYRQIEAWGDEHVGYPMVSGFEEFTYEPDKPIHGDLSEWAYQQRGCISYVCELWDLFRQIGMKRPKRFVDQYTHLRREDLIALGKWDAEHNQSRVLCEWKKVEHPQLGTVEVGGLDPRFGLWNPPFERVAEVCAAQSAMWLRVAALAPQIALDVHQRDVGDGLTEVELRVRNDGYLPTNVLSSAKALPFNEPPWADVDTEGCELVDAGTSHRIVGHLDGWGRGLFDGSNALYFMRSRGSTSLKSLRWMVRGSGVVKITGGGCRTGWVAATVEVGA